MLGKVSNAIGRITRQKKECSQRKQAQVRLEVAGNDADSQLTAGQLVPRWAAKHDMARA